MKRLSILCLTAFLFLVLGLEVQARSKIAGWAAKGSRITTSGVLSTDTTLKVYPSATITFYLTGSQTLASRFSDISGTVGANPTTADNTGYWFAFLDAGVYDIRVSGSGFTAFTFSGVVVTDPVEVFNVRSFGAIGDGRIASNGAMTASTATLTCTCSFVPADVSKVISIAGAGVAGASLTSTILLIGGSGTATLANAASTTVSAKSVEFGTDNATAFASAITTSAAGTLYIPSGRYVTTSSHTVTGAVEMVKGAILAPTTGDVFTLIGPLTASVSQHFSSAGFGTASFSGNRSIPTYYSQWFGAIADGSTDCYPALNALVNTSGMSGTVSFPAGDYLINTALSFPAIVGLDPVTGARLKPATGITVTILGSLPNRAIQFFTNALGGQGTIVFAGNRVINAYYPQWFGAVADGSTDCYPALQALANTSGMNGTISFPVGDYLVNTALSFPAVVGLDPAVGARLKPANSITITILGTLPDRAVQICTNALASQGTISFSGNRAIQSVYPEWWGATPAASAATNTPALQAAIIGAYGNTRTNSSGLWIYNRVLKFSGVYDINDELKVYHMIGFRWEGQNKFNSGINQTAVNKRIIDGQSVAYGVFSQLKFSSTVAQGDGIALLDINYDGSQGNDLRPQNITFNDCFFDGNFVSLMGVWISRAGGGAQGDNIRFYNCYASGFTHSAVSLGGNNTAPLINSGYAYNAIQVQWIGGDIQSCPLYGLASYAGSWAVKNVTVENGTWSQIGYDFYFEAPQNTPLVEGVRSESLRFASAGSIDIVNCKQVQQGFSFDFLAGQVVGLNTLIIGSPHGGDGGYYKVTTPGTLGGLSLQTATSGSATTIVKTGAGWSVNAFVGYRATIMGGTGRRQYGLITGNTSDTITMSAGWVTNYANQLIVDAAAGSTFVIEPNWNKGVIASGTATLTFMDFYSVVGTEPASGVGAVAGADITNAVFIGGRVNAIGAFDNVLMTRTDWAFGSGGNLIKNSLLTYPATVRFDNVHVRRANADPSDYLPWTVPRGSATPYSDVNQFQLGSQPIIWSEGNADSGADALDLYIKRSAPQSGVIAIGPRIGNVTAFGTNQPGIATEIQGGLSTGSGVPGEIQLLIGAVAGSGTQVNPGVVRMKLDGNTTAGQTPLLLWDITAGTLQRVSIGPADSGGIGFRALRISN